MIHFKIQNWRTSGTCQAPEAIKDNDYMNNKHFPAFSLSAVGVASSGGDFMSDLFNKLAMRRKGAGSFMSCELKNNDIIRD